MHNTENGSKVPVIGISNFSRRSKYFYGNRLYPIPPFFEDGTVLNNAGTAPPPLSCCQLSLPGCPAIAFFQRILISVLKVTTPGFHFFFKVLFNAPSKINLEIP